MKTLSIIISAIVLTLTLGLALPQEISLEQCLEVATLCRVASQCLDNPTQQDGYSVTITYHYFADKQCDYPIKIQLNRYGQAVHVIDLLNVTQCDLDFVKNQGSCFAGQIEQVFNTFGIAF